MKTTLIFDVRWDVWWEMRDHGIPEADREKAINDKINAMTPLELLQRISDVLEKKEEDA